MHNSGSHELSPTPRPLREPEAPASCRLVDVLLPELAGWKPALPERKAAYSHTEVVRAPGFALFTFIVLLTTAAQGQFISPQPETSRSMSGQFVAHLGQRGKMKALIPRVLPASANLITLDPSTAVVSCERIKAALYREFGWQGRWSGKISIHIEPALDEQSQITVVCDQFRNSWNYRLQMPQELDRWRFAHAIVQTLLLEAANRNARERSVEIPAWLSEGLTARLLASPEPELIPPASKPLGNAKFRPVTRFLTNGPLNEARVVLRANPPLTIQQLSWPTPLQLAGDDGGVFRSSAHLFVAELLRLKEGPARLSAMIADLPNWYNWQTAFLRAFKPHFERMLDLEKWWALQNAHFTGNAAELVWSPEECWRRLNEAVIAGAQVRESADELPQHSRITLQQAIAEWDYAAQKTALEDKVRVLDLLRWRMLPKFSELLTDYRRVLVDYVQRRERPQMGRPAYRGLDETPQMIIRDTMKRLNELDEARKALEPKAVPVTVAR